MSGGGGPLSGTFNNELFASLHRGCVRLLHFQEDVLGRGLDPEPQEIRGNARSDGTGRRMCRPPNPGVESRTYTYLVDPKAR